MSQELTTPTIAEMSEEMAKYMGIQIQIIKTTKYPEGFTFYYEEDYLGYTETKYHSSWSWIHEVWEKVLSDYNLLYLDKGIVLIDNAEKAILSNNKLEALTSIFNCIQFINRLKQQNETNKSI